ncbi:hypothetical protein ACH4N4_19420 [Streptomyces microflavus]|uniref:TRADD-N-associated membrane domain-containing protein n=1 Tax=Streptomyces microflavus TaxID=1919 RepID=UPI003797FB99
MIGTEKWGTSTDGWPLWAILALLVATLGLVVYTLSAAFSELKEQLTQEQPAAVIESRERLTRAEAALAEVIRSGGWRPIAGGTPDHENANPIVVPGQRDSDSGDPARRSPLELAALWETTHARLGLYHQIATNQATKSFNNAQRAMVAGFALLVVFAGLALWASTTAGAIVAGGLGAVSAALAGYIAKTFVRSQESAATHLRSYFDQPLELSRYLAAERLVADGDLTQEQRGEILTALVQAMVAGPPPPAPPQSVVVASVPGQPGA